MTEPLDRRLHAFRPDLADERLSGRVEALRFVSGEPATIAVSVADLRPAPDLARGIDTQLLFGEAVRVFERRDGWAWVQTEQDGYVGYLPESALQGPVTPTHWISAPRTFVYPEAELRKVPLMTLSMGSRVTVTGEAETRGTRYFTLASGGAVIAAHCLSVETVVAEDYTRIAARFLETPYLWGGRSGFGIDCSGLVQLALMMAGHAAPRDSDMLAAFGTPLLPEEARHGDLVFWKGHVGILEDHGMLLHANGHSMTVAREPLTDAIARIGWLYGQPTGFRRPV